MSFRHIVPFRLPRTTVGVPIAAAVLGIVLTSFSRGAFAQAPQPASLSAANIDDIARLLLLEDTRRFDAAEVERLLGATHPEVRRRAAQSAGRIVNPGALALLRGRPLDPDSAVAATMVWAVGQHRDTASIAWLDSILNSANAPPTVRNEAAIALGKMPAPATRAVLARFLATARSGPGNVDAIRSALLSIGRMPSRGDVAPILRWTSSEDVELRWRATWALVRPRDPAAVPTLLALSADRAPQVRSWAIRGLGMPAADSAGLGKEALARVLHASTSSDRAERTEAINALATYNDPAAVNALVEGLASADSWIAVAAATALGNARFSGAAPSLQAAARNAGSCAVRAAALSSLERLVPSAAPTAALEIVRDPVPYCQALASQTILRAQRSLDEPVGPTRAVLEAATAEYRARRRAELTSPVATTRLAAIRAMSNWADSTDLPALRTVAERARADSTPGSVAVLSAATATMDAIVRPSGRAGGGGGRAGAPPAQTARPFEEYRRIVERWIVPAYMGAPNPTALWETTRGTIELELYAGNAPLAVDDFVKRTVSEVIVGTEFTRVVPNFVDQMAGNAAGGRLRDEVNRLGLMRGNLSWATAGLDTGNPGYTLGHTPQPHNEGNFTSLGRVIGGMDIVDRIELGDRVLSTRMLTRGSGG